MTKFEKQSIEKQVNYIWEQIDRTEPVLYSLAGTDHDDDFHAANAHMKKLCGQLDGIKAVLKVMGYTIYFDPDKKQRFVCTEKQYLRIIGWNF